MAGSLRKQRRQGGVLGLYDREIRHLAAIACLFHLDVLAVPCRRRASGYENRLGIALFLPSFVYVLWNLFAG
jgi:hypothetical protein